MTYALHWPKAFTVSVCLHIFLLAAGGCLLSGLVTMPPLAAETMLEMELVSVPTDRSEIAALVQPADIQPVVPNEAVTSSQPVLPSSEPEPSVAVSDLSMTEAKTPVSQPASQATETSIVTSKPAAGVDTPATSIGRTGFAAPGILSKVTPSYPPAARQAGLEGTVLLTIQILANGRPGDITVARSSGHTMLDEAAIAAVAEWRFVPAKDRSSGRSVDCTTSLPISFRLK
ncbi:MAG: TonB family protein [Firmicutes bacterium]|nr:TonB family protein [Bacillota bacterium]